MKKSLILSSAAVTALTLLATAAPVIAGASTVVGSNNSTAQITFTAPDGTTPLPPITNPTDPGVPATPIPTNPAPFALDYISNLNFGSHVIDGATTTFTTNADATNTAAKPMLAWHDLRGANSGAYTITAQTTGFSANSTITLGAGTATNITPNAPAGGATPFTTSAQTLDNKNQPLTLVSGDGTVPGYFANVFNTPISVSIPVAEQATGAHTATITWNLTSAQ